MLKDSQKKLDLTFLWLILFLVDPWINYMDKSEWKLKKKFVIKFVMGTKWWMFVTGIFECIFGNKKVTF